METLIVHLDNKEQLAALKNLMKAYEISFEEPDPAYNSAKVKEGKKQIKLEETSNINLADL